MLSDRKFQRSLCRPPRPVKFQSPAALSVSKYIKSNQNAHHQLLRAEPMRGELTPARDPRRCRRAGAHARSALAGAVRGPGGVKTPPGPAGTRLAASQPGLSPRSPRGGGKAPPRPQRPAACAGHRPLAAGSSSPGENLPGFFRPERVGASLQPAVTPLIGLSPR